MAGFEVQFTQDPGFEVEFLEQPGLAVDFSQSDTFTVSFTVPQFEVEFGIDGTQGARGNHGFTQNRYVIDPVFREPTALVGDPTNPGTGVVWVEDPMSMPTYWEAERGGHINLDDVFTPLTEWFVGYDGTTDAEVDAGVVRYIQANPDLFGSSSGFDRQRYTLMSGANILVHPDAGIGTVWSANVVVYKNSAIMPPSTYAVNGANINLEASFGQAEDDCVEVLNALVGTSVVVDTAAVNAALNSQNITPNVRDLVASVDPVFTDTQLTDARVLEIIVANENFGLLNAVMDPVFTDTQLSDGQVLTAVESNANFALLLASVDPVFTDTQLTPTEVLAVVMGNGNLNALIEATDPVFTDTPLDSDNLFAVLNMNVNYQALSDAINPVFTDENVSQTVFNERLANIPDDSVPADAVTGLGPLATVQTIDNTIWSGDPLAIENGGSGEITAEAARVAFNAFQRPVAAPSGQSRLVSVDDTRSPQNVEFNATTVNTDISSGYLNSEIPAADGGTNGIDGNDGLMSDADKFRLDAIETGAQVNPDPATPGSDGTNGEDGLMSDADKFKLDGIATGAEVNPAIDATLISDSDRAVQNQVIVAEFTTKADLNLDNTVLTEDEQHDFQIKLGLGGHSGVTTPITVNTPTGITVRFVSAGDGVITLFGHHPLQTGVRVVFGTVDSADVFEVVSWHYIGASTRLTLLALGAADLTSVGVNEELFIDSQSDAPVDSIVVDNSADRGLSIDQGTLAIGLDVSDKADLNLSNFDINTVHRAEEVRYHFERLGEVTQILPINPGNIGEFRASQVVNSDNTLRTLDLTTVAGDTRNYAVYRLEMEIRYPLNSDTTILFGTDTAQQTFFSTIGTTPTVADATTLSVPRIVTRDHLFGIVGYEKADVTDTVDSTFSSTIVSYDVVVFITQPLADQTGTDAQYQVLRELSVFGASLPDGTLNSVPTFDIFYNQSVDIFEAPTTQNTTGSVLEHQPVLGRYTASQTINVDAVNADSLEGETLSILREANFGERVRMRDLELHANNGDSGTLQFFDALGEANGPAIDDVRTDVRRSPDAVDSALVTERAVSELVGNIAVITDTTGGLLDNDDAVKFAAYPNVLPTTPDVFYGLQFINGVTDVHTFTQIPFAMAPVPGIMGTPGNDGFMSIADKTKLDGVEEGAQVNPPEITPTVGGILSDLDAIKFDALPPVPLMPNSLYNTGITFLNAENSLAGTFPTVGVSGDLTQFRVAIGDTLTIQNLAGTSTSTVTLTGVTDTTITFEKGSVNFEAGVSIEINARRVEVVINLDGVAEAFYVDTIVATPTSSGEMSAADKAKLDVYPDVPAIGSVALQFVNAEVDLPVAPLLGQTVHIITAFNIQGPTVIEQVTDEFGVDVRFARYSDITGANILPGGDVWEAATDYWNTQTSLPQDQDGPGGRATAMPISLDPAGLVLHSRPDLLSSVWTEVGTTNDSSVNGARNRIRIATSAIADDRLGGAATNEVVAGSYVGVTVTPPADVFVAGSTRAWDGTIWRTI